MAPRLNKRQQRELEELEALNFGKSQGLNPSSEEEEETHIRPSGGFSNVRSIIINEPNDNSFELVLARR